MKKKILCVIPARKGSKGLKNKNFLIFDKNPLIYYPLLVSTKIKKIDKIVFSTDSNKYANFVKNKFPKVEIKLRGKKLANDFAKTFDVINDVIKTYKKKDLKFDIIILLEPTSPLTNRKMVNDGLNLLLRKYNKIDSVIPLVNLPKFDNFFSINIKKNMFIGKKFPNNTRRQIKKALFLSGNFYISKISSYLKNRGFYSNRTYAYNVNKKYYSDIDDIYEFKEAEFKKKYYDLV